MMRSAVGSGKPLAVIVKGNPKYITDPKVKNKADAFYSRIKVIMEQKGYRVSYDAGEERTRPDVTADVWIAHSRGIDRLRFAPDGVRTYAIETKGSVEGKSNVEIGLDPDHYMLSDTDIKALRAL
jgi:hypothetical protein